MKKIISLTTSIFFLLFFCLAVFGQVSKEYDSALAKKLGADEYGMKKYMLVILKTGSNTTTDKNGRDSLFRGHLANIGRLADHGDLVLAGPMGKNDNNYRGIFILNVQTAEEAKRLLETDPAIKAKLLEPDIYSWYGTAAVMQIPDLHKKIQKTNM